MIHVDEMVEEFRDRNDNSRILILLQVFLIVLLLIAKRVGSVQLQKGCIKSQCSEVEIDNVLVFHVIDVM